MRQIQNHNLAQLLMQLRFTPKIKRQKQLGAAEKLLELVEKSPDTEYPFEFVFFKITGYHAESLTELDSIKGDLLAEDLRIFIAKLSSQVARRISEERQNGYSIEELADNLGVSTKTINRWRKRGLTARKFVFEDGKKRFGFLQSAVNKFLTENPGLINKAKMFSRLTSRDKEQIIKRAASLAEKTDLSRYQIIEQVAGETGKAHETIRYTILNYEKANPERSVFNKPPGVISPSAAEELHKLFKQGTDIKDLTGRFGRSRSSVYRIVNRRRARVLLAEKIEFIDSDEFLEDTAEKKIISRPLSFPKIVFEKESEAVGLTNSSLSKYLRSLRQAPVLNREREIELFRRYNYLKYLVCVNRVGLAPARVLSSRLKKMENYLAESKAIRKMIIESNLRLVVSIAKKHVSVAVNLHELISEGNVSLMLAVEKFDYSKGFRFTTYASWIISKDYARKIPAESARPDKAATASLADVHRNLLAVSGTGVVAIERARKNLITVITDNLTEREQYIIINHFGLIGTMLKKKKKTLKQIGDDLELTKERVRQVELIALQKLRQSLSIEEFELLTGE